MSVDYTKLLDGNSLKAIRTYITTYYQPVNANLTSISGLATNVTGLIKMTNGVASLDGTSYAPLASPTFTGTVTLPTSVKIGTSTSTGLVKYTNGVLSIDTSSYKTDYRYRPISVEGNQKLATTSSAALNFLNPTGYNVVFEWDSTANGIKANVDLSSCQPLDADLTAIAALSGTSGLLKKTAANTWSLDTNTYLTTTDAANTYQPLDADLTAIAALSTTGVVKRTGSNTWSAGSLSASDIPNLSASKITSGTFSDTYIASAATWNAKYSKPSGGIPASDLAETYIQTSAIGVASGVASLGSDGKVPTSQLPESVLGGLVYKGTFNASTATSISGLKKGWYYICATAGSKNPDGTTASEQYDIGDWAICNIDGGGAASWSKIDNTDKVASVNGYTGVVSLTYSDVGAASSGHTHTLSLASDTGTSSITLASAGKYKLTAGGNSLIFTMPTIPSVSLTTTTGSEAITVNSNSLQIVTRDTVQSITGTKRFISIELGEAGSGSGTVNKNGSIEWVSTPQQQLKFIAGTGYNVKFYGLSGSSSLNFSGTDGSAGKINVSWLAMKDGSTHTFSSYLQWPGDKGTSSNPATIATLDDIGSAVSLVTTTGSESITVGSDTLTLMTRDTDQTITGSKTFNGGGAGTYQYIYLGSFTKLVTNNSGSQAVIIEPLHIKGRDLSTTFDINATTGTFTIGNPTTEISQNGTNTVYDKATITRNVKPSGTTTPTTYIYTYPNKSGTFAMMSDVQNTYTEQEALDILTGTAS